MPQRYFLNDLNHVIDGQDAHHIKKVMRMENGDEIIVCSNGACFLASIDVNTDVVTYQIIKELMRPSAIDVTLIQGLPKGSKIDFVAKYATVYGASRIVFVPMVRSIAKLENVENKVKRLTTIAKEAAELAHRFDVPEIQCIRKLGDIDFDAFDLVLLADEHNKTSSIKDAIPHAAIHSKIALIIGPEGGIDDKEKEMLLSRHVRPISLGSHIIPTEAASLYVLSYLSIIKT